MSNDPPEPGRYVQKVHQETQEFIQSLLAENRDLRELTARLESAKAGLTERVGKLETELETAQCDLEIRRQGEERLSGELARAEAQSRQYSSEYVEVERHNSSLANLYVASYRLHGTLRREGVLAALEEIIVNLVGSEEFAIFELGADAALELATAVGTEPEQLAGLTTDSGLIARCVRTGEILAGERIAELAANEAERRLTACIPLHLERWVVGAIAIFSLLAHKGELAAIDLELFDLLATQTASALYLTQLYSAAEAEHEVGR